MKHLTDKILEAAIVAIAEKTFDTHRVIRQIMTDQPKLYAHELYDQGGEDPIMALHAKIGKQLLQIRSVTPTRKVVSANVRGQDNDNQEWVKV